MKLLRRKSVCLWKERGVPFAVKRMENRRASRSSSQQAASTVAEHDLLKAKLEASQARVEVLEMRQKVSSLEAVIVEQTLVIKENTALLRKQRLPKRPYLNHTAKCILAARQRFRCANPDQICPLYKLGDGTFSENGLYEVDHIVPYGLSGLHSGNLHVLCPVCHARRTRLLIAERNRQEGDSDSDNNDD